MCHQFFYQTLGHCLWSLFVLHSTRNSRQQCHCHCTKFVCLILLSVHLSQTANPLTGGDTRQPRAVAEGPRAKAPSQRLAKVSGGSGDPDVLRCFHQAKERRAQGVSVWPMITCSRLTTPKASVYSRYGVWSQTDSCSEVGINIMWKKVSIVSKARLINVIETSAQV